MYMDFFNRSLIRFSWWSIKKVYRTLIVTVIGALFVAVIAFTLYIRSLPALNTWHTTRLKNEFSIHSNIKSIEAYMALEDGLFDELETKVYDRVLPQEQNHINRYTRDSLADPSRWKPNWNRSFELPVENPKGAVLLLHGMSDAPYSLHTQAEYLHQNGYWVLGLRMPGHGTVPSGLTRITWQDMAAVVELGMKYLDKKLGSKPIHIMGYSTGATLALNYTLNALKEDSGLRVPDSLIFYSPAVGVSAAAPLAVWQSRIGHLLGISKLEWNSISPEYDPFKYGSFAVNAGDQVYRLAKRVQEQFDDLEKHPAAKPFPPILSFSSIVDSTVSIPAVIDGLFNRLPISSGKKPTLVLFDINHNFDRNNVVRSAVQESLKTLRNTPLKPSYTFELISNIDTGDESVERIVNRQERERLPYAWSKNLYSLSHLSLPITPDDPLYGNENAPKSPGIQLGHLAMYGETGVLQIAPSALLRQRWNPFHAYIKKRVLAFLKGMKQGSLRQSAP